MRSGTNSVDLATGQIRQLQSMLYDHSKSTNDLFAFTNEILKTMAEASKEINTNYETISAQLTAKMNGKKV